MTLEDFVLNLNTSRMDICIHLFDSHIQDLVKTATLCDSDDDIEAWLDTYFKDYKNLEIIDICPFLNSHKTYTNLSMCEDKEDTSVINFTLIF